MQGILFIDIETVPDLHPAIKTIPQDFAKRFRRELADIPPERHLEFFMERAGLFAEHNKIIAISIGVLKGDKFYVRALTGKYEKELLSNLGAKIIEYKSLGGHNIKEFDCPVLMRRYLANDLPIPSIFNSMGVKPWDLPYHDTMTMWAGSQMNYRVSLDLLCNILSIPSPKNEMDGSGVAALFYNMFENIPEEMRHAKELEVLQKIGDYCNGDNIAAARCFAKLKGLPVFEDNQIIYAK